MPVLPPVRVAWLPLVEARDSLGGLLVPPLDRRAIEGPLADAVIAAVAVREGRPVGAALAHVQPGTATGEVLALGVVPEARRQGLGRALLGAVEAELAGRVAAVQAAWRSDWSGAAAVEGLLAGAGWEPPRVSKLFYKPSAAIYGLPWVQDARLPDGYRVADWGSLSADDRADVQRLVAADPAASEVDPFAEGASPTVSVWLRHGGRVVGWMRAVRRSPALVEYAGLYVAPAHRRLGPARALLAEALRRHRAEQTETPRGVFAVAAENRTMRALAERWFGDEGTARAAVHLAGKRLPATDTPAR